MIIKLNTFVQDTEVERIQITKSEQKNEQEVFIGKLNYLTDFDKFLDGPLKFKNIMNKIHKELMTDEKKGV